MTARFLLLAIALPALALDLRQLPLRFEPNQGQTRADVLYQVRGPRQSVALLADGAAFTVTGKDAMANVRMRFTARDGAGEAEPSGKLESVSHYYMGNDPAAWRTHVPNYSKVTMRGVYRGVDIVYYGSEGRLEYDIVASPDADVSRIGFELEGATGVHLDASGDLVLSTAAGELRWRSPVSYQLDRGVRKAVRSRYQLHGNQVRFELGQYDRSRPLVIDPVLVFSTLLGGADAEIGGFLAVDQAGNSYLGGTTYSRDFPTTAGGINRNLQGLYDGYVTKVNAAGTSLVYSTYVGGSELEIINALTIDARGAAYVTGQTSSLNFPTTTTAYSRARSGFSDVFIAKLNPDGTLGYGTLIGGIGDENGVSIKVDSTGAAYVAGETTSIDFPVTQAAAQRVFGGGSSDGFAVKLDPAGQSLVWCTFIGGRGDEELSLAQAEFLPQIVGASAFAIEIDGQGAAWLAGSTTSADLPTTSNAVNQIYGGGFSDVYLARLSPDGSRFTYLTYLGGRDVDVFTTLTTDVQGNAWVAMRTLTQNLTTTSTALGKRYLGGSFDSYLAKVSPEGSLGYATYFGGRGDDTIYNLRTAGGDLYMVGVTSSADFPTTADAIDATPPRAEKPFLAVLDTVGGSLRSSGFFGGPNARIFVNVGLDGEGNIYVSGHATGPGFTTTTGSFDATYNGGVFDVFLTKFAKLGSVVTGQPGACAFTLDPGALDLTGDPVVATITVLTGADCTWSVSSAVSWATLVGAADRKGPGAVYFSIPANPGTARAGTVRVAGREVNVRQARRESTSRIPPPVVSTLAGNGEKGSAGDGGPALKAQLGAVSGVAVDNRGNLYISDGENHVIRQVTSDGRINTVAGIVGVAGFAGDGGPAARARLSSPEGLATDAAGNLYVADTGSRRVRKISPDGSISTIAGNGVNSSDGDDGPAVRASFRDPANLAIDASGNLYVADRAANRIRKIAPDGTITTAAGSGDAGFGGDGGPAIRAKMTSPAGMAFDRQGNLYIADQLNHRVRRVTTNGNIETIAGTGIAAWEGDLRPATGAALSSPAGVAVDGSGNVYIADRDNHRIRRIDSRGVIITFAGTGTAVFSGDDLAPDLASFNKPSAMNSDAAGNLLIADTGALRVRRIAFPLPPPPATTIRSILNAFGSQATVSGSSLAAIYGENFTTAATDWNSSLDSGSLPKELGGVRVRFNNRDAYLAFVSPTQVNILVPQDLTVGPVPVEVTTANDRGTATAFLSDVSPALLSFPVGGKTAAVAVFEDGTTVAPPGSIEGKDSRSARAGDRITVFATGLGQTNPPIPDGKVLTEPYPLADLTKLDVSVGGKSAVVESAAMTTPGTFQVRFVVPDDPGAGFQPIVVRVRGVASQSGLALTLEE